MVKNVTGFDLSKLIAGSFGTLAAITELTVRALPAPEETRTLVVLGLDDARRRAGDDGGVVERLRRVRRGAPAGGGRGRIVGRQHRLRRRVRRRCCGWKARRPSVSFRAAELSARPAGRWDRSIDAGYARKHRRLARGARRRLLQAHPERQIWRLSVPPAAGAEVVAADPRYAGRPRLLRLGRRPDLAGAGAQRRRRRAGRARRRPARAAGTPP